MKNAIGPPASVSMNYDFSSECFVFPKKTLL